MKRIPLYDLRSYVGFTTKTIVKWNTPHFTIYVILQELKAKTNRKVGNPRGITHVAKLCANTCKKCAQEHI